MSPRHGGSPGAIPGSRTNSFRLRVSTRQSFQNSAYSGQHGDSLPNRKSTIVNHKSLGVVADNECTCPASRLMRARYPPTPPFYPRVDCLRRSMRFYRIRAWRLRNIPLAVGDGSQHFRRHFDSEIAYEKNRLGAHRKPPTREASKVFLAGAL